MIRSEWQADAEIPEMAGEKLRVVNLLAAATKAEIARDTLANLTRISPDHSLIPYWTRALVEAEALSAANGGWAIVHTTPPV